MRLTLENDKKIKSLAFKAQSKYKIPSRGSNKNKNLVSNDAVVRSAIDKLDSDEFLKSIKEKII